MTAGLKLTWASPVGVHDPIRNSIWMLRARGDAKWNESHFSDSEFDELARIAGTTLDETERIQAYADIQRILAERGPVIIPYFFAQFAAIDDGFQGFELKAFPGRTDFRTVSMGQ